MEKHRQIGVFGGSFNPIHFGHIGLAHWIIRETDLDELWLMVTPNNPLKDKHLLAPEQQRLQEAIEAVSASITENPLPAMKQIRVSDYEFYLPRPSYTAQTLQSLQHAFPNDRFTLIIGEDNWQVFTQWRDWQAIIQQMRIFIYPRHGNETYGNRYPDDLPKPDGQHIVLLTNAPYFDISSTQLRSRFMSE